MLAGAEGKARVHIGRRSAPPLPLFPQGPIRIFLSRPAVVCKTPAVSFPVLLADQEPLSKTSGPKGRLVSLAANLGELLFSTRLSVSGPDPSPGRKARDPVNALYYF